MDLKDLDVEYDSQISDAGGGYSVWRSFHFMEQVHFDNHIYAITGPVFAKRTWQVYYMMLLQFTILDAEFKTYGVSGAKEG